MRRRAKLIALIAMVIVIMSAVTPDVCEDTLLLSSVPTSVGESHQDQPFGCQNEGDCFCCAHFAPVQAYTDGTILAFIDTEPPLNPVAALDGTPVALYHPPRA